MDLNPNYLRITSLSSVGQSSWGEGSSEAPQIVVFSKVEGVVSGEMAEEGRGLWVGLEQ